MYNSIFIVFTHFYFYSRRNPSISFDLIPKLHANLQGTCPLSTHQLWCMLFSFAAAPDSCQWGRSPQSQASHNAVWAWALERLEEAHCKLQLTSSSMMTAFDYDANGRAMRSTSSIRHMPPYAICSLCSLWSLCCVYYGIWWSVPARKLPALSSPSLCCCCMHL